MDRAGRERGVTAVAYALMVAIIAVLLVGGVFVLGDSIKSAFDGGADCVTSPSDCGGNGSGSGGGNGGGSGTTSTTRPASTSTSTTARTAP